MGEVLNSSVQMAPLCLADEFAFRQTSHYCMRFVNKPLEKTFFCKLIFAAKSFYGGSYVLENDSGGAF